MFEALATTGGRPIATSTGKLRRDATPTVEVKIPAPNPAASTANISGPLTDPPYGRRAHAPGAVGYHPCG